MLEDEGLIADVVYTNSNENRDIVISQSEEKGTLLEKGSTVTIYVSNGLPPTTTPPTEDPSSTTDPSSTEPSSTEDPSSTDPTESTTQEPESTTQEPESTTGSAEVIL